MSLSLRRWLICGWLVFEARVLSGLLLVLVASPVQAGRGMGMFCFQRLAEVVWCFLFRFCLALYMRQFIFLLTTYMAHSGPSKRGRSAEQVRDDVGGEDGESGEKKEVRGRGDAIGGVWCGGYTFIHSVGQEFKNGECVPGHGIF